MPVGSDSRQQNRSEITPKIVDIWSDQLIVDHGEKLAEFVGNVKAVRGASTMTADRLKVYYRERGGKSARTLQGIEKIVAEGNVRITSGELEAEAGTSTYDPRMGTIVLSGKNTRVTTGKNTVSGSNITLFVEEERIRVSGGSGGRVRTVIDPSKKSSRGN